MTHAVYRAKTYWIFGSADMVGVWVIKRATVLFFVAVYLLHLQLPLLKSGLALSREFGVFVSFGGTSRRDLHGFNTRERDPSQRKALPFLPFLLLRA